MTTHKQTLFQAVLARISLGAVPVDGHYWFDPRDAGIAPVEARPKTPETEWSPLSLSLFRRRP